MSVENIKRRIASVSRQAILIAEAEASDGAIMRVLWSNGAFRKLTGYTRSDIVGCRGSILAGPSMAAETHLQIIERLMNWETFEVVTPNNRKDQSEYRQWQHWVPVTDGRSGRRYWILFVSDVSAAPAGFGWQDLGGAVSGPGRPVPTGIGAGDMAPVAEPAVVLSGHASFVVRSDHSGPGSAEGVAASFAPPVAGAGDIDALTGVLNRSGLQRAEAYVERATVGSLAEVAAIFVDVDNFKFINDNFGHDFGDRVLCHVAATLRACVGPSPYVVRMGGDEFVVLIFPAASALDLCAMADRIVERVRVPVESDDRSVSCTASVGLAISSTLDADVAGLIASADFALYRAKEAGRNRWSMYDRQAHNDATRTRRLANELGTAIEQGDLVVHYQPQLTAGGRVLAGMEALVRWAHPEEGLMAPDSFLPIAERLNLINRVDKAVLERVALDIKAWRKRGLAVPTVSVNVSAKRLRGSELASDLVATGVPIGDIAVEILESAFVDDVDSATRWTIDELKEMGVAIDIDDFGSGHASILGLLTIEPRRLKIDRMLVKPIVHDPAKRELIRSIVQIGHGLGIGVVAEGVETPEHMDAAEAVGCDLLQGYAIARPLPPEQILPFLEARQPSPGAAGSVRGSMRLGHGTPVRYGARAVRRSQRG
jgi:diguanylate cyclase (GGDEF)-like protein